MTAPVNVPKWRPNSHCRSRLPPQPALQGCPRLRRLALRHCGGVTDVGVRAMATRCKQLQVQGCRGRCCHCPIAPHMWGCSFGAEPRWARSCPAGTSPSSRHFSPCLFSPCLQELVLDRTAVGDAGVLHAARDLPLLRTLCITNYTHNRCATMLWGAVVMLCCASRCAPPTTPTTGALRLQLWDGLAWAACQLALLFCACCSLGQFAFLPGAPIR